jgi:hypothetical protein
VIPPLSNIINNGYDGKNYIRSNWSSQEKMEFTLFNSLNNEELNNIIGIYAYKYCKILSKYFLKEVVENERMEIKG